MKSHLTQSINAAKAVEDMIQAAIAEYEAKGFKVERFGDEIIVTGKPDAAET